MRFDLNPKQPETNNKQSPDISDERFKRIQSLFPPNSIQAKRINKEIERIMVYEGK